MKRFAVNEMTVTRDSTRQTRSPEALVRTESKPLKVVPGIVGGKRVNVVVAENGAVACLVDVETGKSVAIPQGDSNVGPIVTLSAKPIEGAIITTEEQLVGLARTLSKYGKPTTTLLQSQKGLTFGEGKSKRVAAIMKDGVDESSPISHIWFIENGQRFEDKIVEELFD